MLLSNGPVSSRKRVLVVNCYFDETRLPLARTNKIPQGAAPLWLAGGFSRDHCDVKVFSELYSGPLEDEALLGWPDMLVLTGMNTAFDRMLHLTAYARTKNPHVIVVAGGPVVRALPKLCAQYFDYCCLGDVEEIKQVIRDAWGEAFVAEDMAPRFELAPWARGRIGYAESSRNCNFRCSFCTLTAQNRAYRKYPLDDIRRQILAQGRKEVIVFLDNNFYGNDRDYFLARMDLLRELKRDGKLGGWAALVTNDFFLKDENLTLAKDAGCEALFSGVESFDTAWLRSFNKAQNTKLPQVELIRKCLDAGIVFLYGMMLDTGSRSVADIHRELDFITSTPEITLPSYLSIPIPMLGTPFFKESVRSGALLPNVSLRDLDSTTIALQPHDPLHGAARFVRDLQFMRGYRTRVLTHSFKFARRYGSSFNRNQMLIALSNALLLCAPAIFTAPSLSQLRARRGRTHIAGTETLDACYTPAFKVDARYERYFQPTMLTDARGKLTDAMEELMPTINERSSVAVPELSRAS